MTLLIDLFGYLSVIVHGLTIVAQSMALGGAIFLIFLARPFEPELDAGGEIRRRTRRIALWSTLALILAEAVTLALQSAVLIGTVDIDLGGVMGAEFAVYSLIKIGGAVVLALCLADRQDRAPAGILGAAIVIVLAAATGTTHAAARLDNRAPLMVVEGLHQLGAAIWIGGLPCFVMALARCHDGGAWRRVGKRFSQMSTLGVLAILVSGVFMAFLYVGSWDGFYGTAYGVMVFTKIMLFLALLAMGAMNYRLVERLRRDPNTPVTRLKRFAEVEMGVGFTLFFAAASLTSSPPAVDLTNDRVSWAEVVERNVPMWPRLSSPDHADLGIPALQIQLDAEAAQQAKKPPPAFVPGSGDLPPRNAFDIAWSEYNHHWAGLFVLAIGFLALLNQAGLRWARHWPLVFLGLAGFLFVRSDPEVWPLGDIGFFDSFRDVEVAQHRVFVLMLVVFAFFEWRVRVGGLAKTKAALVFPLITALGGLLLLTHQHAIANVKDQLLIELTHTPLALAGIAAGWSRWLELRLDPPANRWAGWVWPICFLLVGLVLLSYREA
ncbi:MAG TPA: CopD family protein [Aliidongia sp.]|nr:CopD family protein [Aliidongia sp.]